MGDRSSGIKGTGTERRDLPRLAFQLGGSGTQDSKIWESSHSGRGYRLRGLRYEIIPGFQTTALLYEPENLAGKVPAIVNVNGHTPVGNATGYKQIRCINYAQRGMLALSLEWFNCGELHLPGNDHWFGGHMNLAGMSATGLFYLAMRKGLDYLERHPHVDPGRLGVTGLSGGAWQTGVLSGLDERVAAAAPVSGYFAFLSAIERNADVGDMEYNPPDLGIDYTHLTALRAPRPTLLMFSAEDNYYVGRAVLTKPYLYDQIMPFFRLFGKEEVFEWHENTDPGTHNYELDNRQQSYRFFSRHFGLPVQAEEIPVDAEVKTAQELRLGIPEDNLTILALARKLAGEIEQESPPGEPERKRAWVGRKRQRLQELVRYRSRSVQTPLGRGQYQEEGSRECFLSSPIRQRSQRLGDLAEGDCQPPGCSRNDRPARPGLLGGGVTGFRFSWNKVVRSWRWISSSQATPLPKAR